MNLYLSEREAGCLKNSFPLTQGKLFAIGDGKKKKIMEKAVTIKLTKSRMNGFILVHCV